MAPMPFAQNPSPPPTHLLYLHGFRSSPRSHKAVMVSRWVAQHQPQVRWWCPQLPPSPREAMDLVTEGIADWPRERMGVIGSSLGGFYAACVAQATGCPAVLLNPAVHPARDLARHIGEQTAWHDPSQRFHFDAAFIDELHALEPGPLAEPHKLFAVVAKGDEVLDWREMVARFAGARIELIEGGDHALSDFEQRIDEVMGFLGLARGSPFQAA
ncbi:YqiA/YcfP family alpha/beta fold hydrolase [Ramlibacter sp. AN1015]|uniref:YqiA/YcfP family alpha/beta fold hydrolase n=1 Tax=Ramlibacter sp. AN1015 TaxID=3133428 RepID=UPI0030C195B4